jgi:hypothetical protein
MSRIFDSPYFMGVTVLDSVEQLRHLPVKYLPLGPFIRHDHNIVMTKGAATINDGLGAFYYYDTSSSEVDNGLSVIKPNSNPATGRWKELSSMGTIDTHALLSAIHSDVTPASVDQGSLITGQDTGGGVLKWKKLAVGDPGEVLSTDGDDVFWLKAPGSSQFRWLSDYSANLQDYVRDYGTDHCLLGIDLSFSTPATSSLVVPDNINICEFLPGSIITIPDGDASLTINNFTFRGCYQVFDVSNGVALSLQTINSFNPLWFSNIRDGTAIRYACEVCYYGNSDKGKVILSGGTFTSDTIGDDYLDVPIDIVKGSHLVIETGCAPLNFNPVDHDYQLVDCVLADVPVFMGKVARPEHFGIDGANDDIPMGKAAAALSGGGELICNGSYIEPESLTVATLYSNTKVYGTGSITGVFHTDGFFTATSKINISIEGITFNLSRIGTFTSCDNIKIRKNTLNGYSAEGGGRITQQPVRLNGCTNSIVEENVFYNCRDHVYLSSSDNLISGTRCSNITIQNNTFENTNHNHSNNYPTGVYIFWSSGTIKILGNKFKNIITGTDGVDTTGYGIYEGDGAGEKIIIKGNTFELSENRVMNGAWWSTADAIVSNNQCINTNAGTAGNGMTGIGSPTESSISSSGLITNNICTGCGISILLSGPTTNKKIFTITDNQINNSQSFGISIAHGTNGSHITAEVSRNIINKCVLDGIYNFIIGESNINDNTIIDANTGNSATYCGIRFLGTYKGTCSRNKIINNTGVGYARYGIEFSTNNYLTRFQYFDNTFSGMITGNFHNGYSAKPSGMGWTLNMDALNSVPTDTNETGWRVVYRADKVTTQAYVGVTSVLDVASTSGSKSGDIIGVVLASGAEHWTTINGTPTSTQYALASATPSAIDDGAVVVILRWKNISPTFDPTTLDVSDAFVGVAVAEANAMYRVVWGNGRFVAVSTDGTNRVQWSQDGVFWTVASLAENNTMSGLCYGNGKFVAVSTDGTNRVQWSYDGITWVVASAAAVETWDAVQWGKDKFVAASYTGKLMYSADAITWTSATNPESMNILSVTYGNGRFLAVSTTGTKIVYSLDGINWTGVTVTGNQWYCACFYDGKFVVVGVTGTNRTMWSYDCITWHDVAAVVNNSWSFVTGGSCGGKGFFIAVSGDGTNRIMYSRDALVWYSMASAEQNILTCVCNGNGRFLITSYDGTYRASYSGDLLKNTLPDHTHIGVINSTEGIFYPTDYGDHTRSGTNIALACAAVVAAGRGIVRLTGGTFAVTASADFLSVPIDVLPGSYIIKSDAAVIAGLNIKGFPDYQVVSCNVGYEPVFKNSTIGSKWFGALGDGTTDDTSNLQKAFNSLTTRQRLLVTIGAYKVTSKIIRTIPDHSIVEFDGNAYLYAVACTPLKLFGYWISVINYNSFRSSLDFTADNAGIEFDGLVWSTISIGHIYGFQKGISCLSTEVALGLDESTYTYNNIDGCKYGIYTNCTNDGYCNANTWIGGGIRNDGTVKALISSGSWAVYQDGSGPYYGNAFLRLTIQGHHKGLRLFGYNYDIDIRYLEYTDDNWLSGLIAESKIWLGVGNYDYTKMDIGSDSRWNVWNGRVSSGNVTQLFEDISGGIGFIDRYSRKLAYSLQSSWTQSAMFTSGPGGEFGNLNKHFENNVSPVIGTYQKGAIVWNNVYPTGNVLGWICTTAGTMGTLTGVTADGTSGNDYIDVNDASNIYLGCLINLPTIGQLYVKGIIGNRVYTGDVLAINISGVSVTFSAAIFLPIYNQNIVDSLTLAGAAPKITFDVTGGGTIYDGLIEFKEDSTNRFNFKSGGQEFIYSGGASGEEVLINAAVQDGAHRGVGLQYLKSTKFFADSNGNCEVLLGDLKVPTAGKGLVFSDNTIDKTLISDSGRYVPAYSHSWYKGEAWYYTATGGTPAQAYIDTTLLYHAIVLATTAGAANGFTHLAGQANAIASVAENSAGVSFKVTTTGNHNLTAGQPITHTGFTTRTTYRGKYIVQSCPSATEYIVLGTYLGTDTGFMKRAFTLRANTGTAGIFRTSYHITLSANSASTLMKVEVNKNISDCDNIAGSKDFRFANDMDEIVSSGHLTIAAGDYIWLSIANLTDATDYKIYHCNLSIG